MFDILSLRTYTDSSLRLCWMCPKKRASNDVRIARFWLWWPQWLWHYLTGNIPWLILVLYCCSLVDEPIKRSHLNGAQRTRNRHIHEWLCWLYPERHGLSWPTGDWTGDHWYRKVFLEHYATMLVVGSGCLCLILSTAACSVFYVPPAALYTSARQPTE